MPRTERRNSE